MGKATDFRLRIAKGCLNRRVEDLMVPTYRGIPIKEFDRESLIKICTLFAYEWHKSEGGFLQILRQKTGCLHGK